MRVWWRELPWSFGQKHCKFAYDANSKAEEDQFISVLTMVLHIPGQDVCPSTVTLLIHGPLRSKSQSSLRFTTMPILFFGHIAAMLLCWCLMTSGSVAWSEAAALWCLGKILTSLLVPLYCCMRSYYMVHLLVSQCFIVHVVVFLQCFIWFLIILIAVLMQYVLGFVFLMLFALLGNRFFCSGILS